MICRRFACILFLVAALPGCSSVPRIVNEYKTDVQQGNVLTQEMVAQLKPGQTRDQVRFILGTPMITDIFHANRWDYVYQMKKGSTGEVETRQFSVFFNADGRLERVAGDVAPADAAATAAVTPENRIREIELGSVGDDYKAPPVTQRGFFGRMLESIGF